MAAEIIRIHSSTISWQAVSTHCPIHVQTHTHPFVQFGRIFGYRVVYSVFVRQCTETTSASDEAFSSLKLARVGVQCHTVAPKKRNIIGGVVAQDSSVYVTATFTLLR